MGIDKTSNSFLSHVGLSHVAEILNGDKTKNAGG